MTKELFPAMPSGSGEFERQEDAFYDRVSSDAQRQIPQRPGPRSLHETVDAETVTFDHIKRR